MAATQPLNRMEPAQPYQPTQLESTAIDAWRARLREKAAVPRIKVSDGKTGEVHIKPDHPDLMTAYILLEQATGSSDFDFLTVLIDQLANAASVGRGVDEAKLNAMLSVVKSIQPRDQIETMLAAQMAAVHNATMTFARRLDKVENIPPAGQC